MDEVLSFLKDCKTFFVATVDGDRPRVRPFGFVMQHEAKLYFVTGNHKPFYEQIVSNPNIEMCGMNAKMEWLRLRGKAVCDTRQEIAQRAFDEEPNLVYVYKTPDNPKFACFYLDQAEAEFCTMAGESRTVML